MFRKNAFLLIAVVLALRCSTGAGQECYSWIDRTPQPVPGRIMVFDANRNVLVAMGGTVDARTWEWDGANWTNRSSSPPFVPNSAKAVYDSSRRVILVYDGSTIGDTWEWAGTNWILRSQTGPGTRSDFGLAFDGVRGVAVLHGGRDPNNSQLVFSDTWEWTGTEWALVDSAGPTRARHAMAFDSWRGATVLNGGRGVSSVVLQDTWEWDGSSWTQVALNTGPALDRVDMVFDSFRNLTVCFLRSIGDWSEEWTWDGFAWTSRPVTEPYGPYESPLAFDSMRGLTLARARGLWAWDGDHWTLLGNGQPTTSAVAYDRANDRILAVEGLSSMSRIWEYEEDHWTIINSNGPSTGCDPAIAYDEARQVLVLFGGSDNRVAFSKTFFGDTWEWDGSTWAHRASDGPLPRCCHKMVYDAARGVVVLFGGWNGTNLGDTWEWDGATWSLRATTGPSPRFWSGLTYDRQRNVSLLVGGGSYNGWVLPRGGIWEWNGQGWTARTAQLPGVYAPALMFDEARGVNILVGGFSIGSGDETVYVPGTWEGHGDTWELKTTAGTISGTGVHDVQRGVNLVVGDTDAFWFWNYPSTLGTLVWLYPWYAPPITAPVPETQDGNLQTVLSTKNRYLSFTPPEIIDETTEIAFRVIASQLPGPANCPNVSDFSDRFQSEMWIGDEAVAGGGGTGLYRLSSTPVFRDWSTVPGGVVHVADCNIVPCASYSIEAVSDIPCDPGVPAVYSEPVIIATAGVWGDVVGGSYDELPNGIVDFVDISACVDRFRNSPIAPPGTWCDVGGNNPTQGVALNIDFADISLVVDAFRGLGYPFSGPTAPDPCP